MTPKRIFGAKLKNHTKLMESQSGGAFAAIAEYFLKHKGIVYGCGMDSDLNVIYKRIENIDELKLIKGSKYVQAKLNDTFKHIEEDLDNGLIVLFSGTPCYVAAVKELVALNKNKNNLYTIDIICHGVPSPLIYKTYLEELETLNRSKISQFIFRAKIAGGGWNKHMEKIIYENSMNEIREDYTKIFYTNLSLRPSCGKCKFACVDRVADFTVGDFWGVQNKFPEFYDERGVSIVFLNSERAINIWSEVSNTLEIIETDIEHAMQPNLIAASKIPKFKKIFWNDFRKKGAIYCAKKWPPIIEFPITLKTKLKKVIKYIINR